LLEAHEVLSRKRPKVVDAPSAWIAYYRLAAEVYAQVAKVDKDHKHEAQALAGCQIRQAREIEDRVGGG
jgi:hypothetical protein